MAMLTARGEPWYSTHICDARTWHHRRVQMNADVSAAGPLPDALVLINTGLCGRGLAVKHGVNRDVMIARGVCTAWGNALKQSPPSGSASGTSSGQAFEDDFDTDVVVLGRFLLQRLAASRDSGSFAEWPSGPRHWLGLPGTKSVLRSRCRDVRKMFEKSHQKIPFNDAEILDVDLQRIGSGIASRSKSCINAVPGAFSLLNHSCSPNAEVRWEGGDMSLYSLRPIAAGEEVCVSYIDELEGVLSRRYFLLQYQGFLCLCPRCQANFSGIGDELLLGCPALVDRSRSLFFCCVASSSARSTQVFNDDRKVEGKITTTRHEMLNLFPSIYHCFHV